MSLTSAEKISDAILDLEELEVNFNSLTKIVTDKRIALNLLLVGQGRAYVITNISSLPGLILQARRKGQFRNLRRKLSDFPS